MAIAHDPSRADRDAVAGQREYPSSVDGGLEFVVLTELFFFETFAEQFLRGLQFTVPFGLFRRGGSADNARRTACWWGRARATGRAAPGGIRPRRRLRESRGGRPECRRDIRPLRGPRTGLDLCTWRRVRADAPNTFGWAGSDSLRRWQAVSGPILACMTRIRMR